MLEPPKSGGVSERKTLKKSCAKAEKYCFIKHQKPRVSPGLSFVIAILLHVNIQLYAAVLPAAEQRVVGSDGVGRAVTDVADIFGGHTAFN